jgi:hypothetical protein
MSQRIFERWKFFRRSQNFSKYFCTVAAFAKVKNSKLSLHKGEFMELGQTHTFLNNNYQGNKNKQGRNQPEARIESKTMGW